MSTSCQVNICFIVRISIHEKTETPSGPKIELIFSISTIRNIRNIVLF